MADIDFYQEDSDDNSDSSLGLDDTGVLEDDCYGPDDHLSPLQKLEKYMNSDNIFSRQMVAKSMLDTLRAVGGEREECDAVLKAMVRLSDDAEATVRSELMEQVPHVAMYCLEKRHIFQDSVPTYLLPMVVKYLNDMNNQVRKTSQAALLVLLEQELVDRTDIEEQVVGVIADLARPDSPDDFRTEAVALMSKMAPLLGREMTEAQFLPRFCEMCTDSLFHVRKVCAANFGDICTVVGPESVEEQLLPKFYYLCEDGVWGVRKACAECFMVVSRACTSETRRSQLSGIFVNLLCDLSRWVRIAAFQALGPFISTYADPRIMELLIREGITSVEGEITCDINVEDKPGVTEQAKSNEEESNNKASDSDTPNNSFNEEEKKRVWRTGYIMWLQRLALRKELELDLDCDTKDQHIDSTDKSVEEIRSEKYMQESDSKKDESQDSDSNKEKKISQPEVLYECATEVEKSEPSICRTEDTNESTNEHTQIGEHPCSVDKDVTSDTSTSSPDTLESKTDDSSIEDDNSVFSEDRPSDSQITTETCEDGRVHIHVDNVATYNNFQFWRTPIPAVDLDLDIVNGTPTNIHLTAKVKDEDNHKIYATKMDISLGNKNNSAEQDLSQSLAKMEIGSASEKALVTGSAESNLEKAGIKIHTASVSTVCEAISETVSNIGSTHVLGHNLGGNDSAVQDIVSNSIGYIDSDSVSSTGSSMRDSAMFDDSALSQQQDVIPPHLLEHYLSMVDPSRAQTVDTEITRHCAYSLPAVAFTLGRKNWPCLKILYETLASDMQWKVRRTLAFSIHELALIVGEDITHEDLVPVFDGFLKDLDEVRVGVLKHFSDFLRLLRPEVRQSYLPRVQDFLTTDNQRNWRFRMELADQLILLCELFTGRDICEHLIPVAMTLVGDKVAEVRQISCRLLAVMMRRLSEDQDDRMVHLLVNDITERFARSNKWYGRQLYAQLCLYLLEENALPPEDFANLLLPSLLFLSSDSIPNVRISLAKTLSQMVMPSDYFTSYQNPHHEELLQSIQSLKSDSDKDVRYFSSLEPDQTSFLNMNIPV
ncbi:LOW QUALITY PROTEIN: serine/threonine-protein phosphatase 4 regulatory subunit 1-like [Liolophura sinensis]|uniref:LOW QUALITY PROTEIN: serine/threonine-protein phosphatase 4 regulatory subunit 1-like n=1 Tax=Liolophura sinensis TaxID=3198878 RepID=UPI0031588EE9